MNREVRYMRPDFVFVASLVEKQKGTPRSVSRSLFFSCSLDSFSTTLEYVRLRNAVLTNLSRFPRSPPLSPLIAIKYIKKYRATSLRINRTKLYIYSDRWSQVLLFIYYYYYYNNVIFLLFYFCVSCLSRSVRQLVLRLSSSSRFARERNGNNKRKENSPFFFCKASKNVLCASCERSRRESTLKIYFSSLSLLCVLLRVVRSLDFNRVDVHCSPVSTRSRFSCNERPNSRISVEFAF